MREVMHPLTQLRVFIRLTGPRPVTPIGAARKPEDLTSIPLGIAQLDQVLDGIMTASWA